MTIDRRDRFRGALAGLATGDALGTPLEFTQPGSFARLDDMVGGGPFRLKAGQWTDDTSMALCLAESLAECGGFDPADQMRRYVRWWREGYLSSTGVCFDIGGATSAALWAFHTTDTFRDACLAAANLGDDADTTAAICGQIAGAYYGHEAIPAPWRAMLHLHDRIVALADRLHVLAYQDEPS